MNRAAHCAIGRCQAAALITCLAFCGGCRQAGNCVSAAGSSLAKSCAANAGSPTGACQQRPDIQRASFESDDVATGPTAADPPPASASRARSDLTLTELERLALANNPAVRRMREEAEAAWQKTRSVDRLPDPSLGANFFVPPMNFEPERQVGEVQFMQMLPWLGRLRAEARRACLEAMVAENLYQAERLRVLAAVRTAWCQLYVWTRQAETLLAEKAQLESLVEATSRRVSTGNAQPGDVLLATLELSSLQEQIIQVRRQAVAATVELNRLLGRDSETPVPPPAEIASNLPDWNPSILREAARNFQPEWNAARLKTAATRWGIEIARLQRRPELTLGVGWVVMDAPGAIMPEAGRDNLSLGVSTTLPIDRRKYDALASEAAREHFAAHALEDEVASRINALLRDLWEQARAQHETLLLYRTSSLPQARQTLQADLQSLATNAVTFERVIQDWRAMLKLETGYHRVVGDLAITLARIRQAVGDDLRDSGGPR